MEREESLAIVAVPNGILLPSIILGKSAKSWRVIAKNIPDCGSTPSHCLCCSYILRLVLLHLSLGNPKARHSVTYPLHHAPADLNHPIPTYDTLPPMHIPHKIPPTQIHKIHHYHTHTHTPLTHTAHIQRN